MKGNFILALLVIAICPLNILSQNPDQERPQRKIALVIGNGNYPSSTLANPENDARSMASVLQQLGFIVYKYENLSQVQMKKAIDDFGLKLKGNDVGLFFYAGHGIQSKGYNYLIPVDAQLQSEQEVEYDCVQADRILAKMEGSGTKVNIIILDACRNNPFERSWTRSETGKGLAFMNAPSGTLIAYSTAPGNTALDGSGQNSPYTTAILENIVSPGITVLQMFQNVRATVTEKSNKQQTPWESTSLIGDFYFNTGSAFQAVTTTQINSSKGNGLKSNHYVSIPTNGIKINEIIEKPTERKEMDGTINKDTILFAVLDKGLNSRIKHKTYLEIYQSMNSESQISGELIVNKPKKIGYTIITNSYKTKSEGRLHFNKGYSYKKSFDLNENYAKIKKIWASCYISTRITTAGTPGIGVGILAYNNRIGGYIEGSYYATNFYNNDRMISGGLIKNITHSTALRIGTGIAENRIINSELGGLTRLNNVALIYGINYAVNTIDKETDTRKPALGLTIGLGFIY